MNVRQAFQKVIGNSDKLHWQSRVQVTAIRRRKNNLDFMRRRLELQERQRNAQANRVYRECKG